MCAAWFRTIGFTLLLAAPIQVVKAPKAKLHPQKKADKDATYDGFCREVREAEFEMWERNPRMRFMLRVQLVICWYASIVALCF